MLQLWRLCVDNLLMALLSISSFHLAFPVIFAHYSIPPKPIFIHFPRCEELTRLILRLFLCYAGTTVEYVALQPFVNEYYSSSLWHWNQLLY